MTASIDQLVHTISCAITPSWGHLDPSPKVFTYPDRMALFLADMLERIPPVNAEAWPSVYCTARCPSCPYRMNGAREEADRFGDARQPLRTVDGTRFFMSVTAFSDFARQFGAVGGRSITITGGGEPLENNQTPTFGKICRDRGLAWGIYTNGQLLSPSKTDELLEHVPTFVRPSVNAHDKESHNDVYHLGLSAYDRLRSHVTYLARTAPPTTTVGLGYVLDHVEPNYLNGMRAFLAAICKDKGRIDYVAVRPSVIYYDPQGNPRSFQPHRERYARVPEQCRQGLGKFCNDHGISLQINDQGFEALAAGRPPSPALATPWATSLTHDGQCFLLSEANGSTQPELADLCYGKWSPDLEFKDLWFGPRRQALARSFAEGRRLAPAWHKLAGTDDVLFRIREAVGILDFETAKSVATRLAPTESPAHSAFI